MVGGKDGDIGPALSVLQKDFDFKDKHVAILKAVSSHGSLTADEICAKASIPKGRVYDFLNYLVDNRLVKKSDDTPAKYSFDAAEDRFGQFLNHASRSLYARSAELIALTETNAFESTFSYTREKDVFNDKLAEELERCKSMNILLRSPSVPILMFPWAEDKFIERFALVSSVRQTLSSPNKAKALKLFRAYKKAMESKDLTFLMSAAAVDEYVALVRKQYGDKQVRKEIAELNARLEKSKRVRIFVTKDKSVLNFHLTDTSVLLAIITNDVWLGMSIESPQIALFYSRSFASKQAKALRLQEYWAKYA